MSTPQLPPEIYDLFIDQLFDSSRDLKSCCLVSKSWLPRSRKHLFYHVLVTRFFLRARNPSELIDTEDAFRASFHSVFQLPGIALCVQRLSLGDGERTLNDDSDDATLGVGHTALPISSVQQLASFQNIRSLTLNWFILSAFGSPFSVFEGILNTLTQLEHLKVRWVTVHKDNAGDTNDFFGALAARCALLKTLCIEHLIYPALFDRRDQILYRKVIDSWQVRRAGSLAARSIPLKSLVLSDTSTAVVENIILVAGCFNTMLLERILILGTQLYLLAPYDLCSLTHLTLKADPLEEDIPLNSPTVLIPSLKHLQFVVKSSRQITSLFKAVRTVIRISSDSYDWSEQVDLHIEGPDDLFTTSVGGSNMDVELNQFLILTASRSLPWLRTVTINQEPAVLWAQFPKSAASGILMSGRGNFWWDDNYW